MSTHSHTSSLPLKKRTKLDLPNIIRRLVTGDRYLGPSAEELFELYRMLLRSAGQTVKVRGGQHESKYPGLAERLGRAEKYGNKDNFGSDWKDDIARRILYIFFGASGEDSTRKQWLRDSGFDVQKPIFLTLPMRGALLLNTALDALFGIASESRRTKKAYNKVHPIAKAVTSVALGIEEGMWVVTFKYQYPGEQHGSHWTGPAIKQKADEPFADFVCRAREELNAMMTPACTHKSAPIYSSLACFVGFCGRSEGSRQEFIAGECVEEFAKMVEMPTPFTSDVVRFKGDLHVFWRGPDTWGRPEEEPTEDFWILLPGSRIPTRLLVHFTSKGELCYRGELPNRQEGFGLYAPSNSGAKVTERFAREARARLLLTQSAYRRGFLNMKWSDHSKLNVDEILHPTTGSPIYGRSPRQKEDAVRYTKEVRSILWQSDDLCPVFTKAHCESGVEDERPEDNVDVVIGPSPSHDGAVTDQHHQLAAQLNLTTKQAEILCSVLGNALVPALGIAEKRGGEEWEGGVKGGILEVLALSKAIAAHAHDSDPPLLYPYARASAVAAALHTRGFHATPSNVNGFYVAIVVAHPRSENGALRFGDAPTKVIMYDVDLPHRRDMGAIAIANEIIGFEGLHVRMDNDDDDAARKLIALQIAQNKGLGIHNG